MFPSSITAKMDAFIAWAINKFKATARPSAPTPARGRFILAGHSGGGRSLNDAAAFPMDKRPHEVRTLRYVWACGDIWVIS